jgi:hypothetical protein
MLTVEHGTFESTTRLRRPRRPRVAAAESARHKPEMYQTLTDSRLVDLMDLYKTDVFVLRLTFLR